MTQIVNACGPKDAKIMLVGEAPGAQEAKQGKPFVGPAGKLLNECLRYAGINRQECYITNVIKERPPKNNIKPFINLSADSPISGTSMGERAIEYIEMLEQEIRTVDPNVIVPLGSVANWALTGIRKGITKWRGSIIESTLVPSKKVIPCIHPSAALRMYIWRYFIIFDLQRVRDESSFPEIREPAINLIIGPSFRESIDYLHACENNSRISFDIEVYNEEVSCISFSHSGSSAISIPFIYENGAYFDPEQELEIWLKIADLLEDNSIEKLAQNANFDTSFLFRKYGIKAHNLEDTMIAEAILYPDFPKGLDFITTQYTKIPYYKDDGKFTQQNNRKFWLYNAKDAIVLMQAFPAQETELNRLGNTDSYKHQSALLEPLLFLTEHGMKIDTEGLQRKHEETEFELQALEKELNKLAGKEINPRSPKQLQEYFYIDLGIKAYRKGGRPTTDEKALKQLAAGTSKREGRPEASILLRHRELQTLDSRYYTMKLDDDNRLRSSMNPVGTRYSRLSSSKTIFGTGANMQNQPHSLKEYQLVDEGCVGFEIDLGQAENRIVAYLGPDPTMIDAFENGKDIHSLTASFIAPAFGENLTPEEIREQADNDINTDKIGKGNHPWRYWGKKSNHALNYGLGVNNFAEQLEIPKEEARAISNRYHSGYPGVHQMHRMVEEQLKKNRTLTNLYGRKYTFTDRWGGQLFKDAYAYIPQSSVAEKINREGILFMYYSQFKNAPLNYTYNPMMECTILLNQVHDSVVFQIPLEYGWRTIADAVDQIVKSLETPLSWRGREFVIPAEVEVYPENFLDGFKIDIHTSSATELEYKYKEYMEKNQGEKL